MVSSLWLSDGFFFFLYLGQELHAAYKALTEHHHDGSVSESMCQVAFPHDLICLLYELWFSSLFQETNPSPSSPPAQPSSSNFRSYRSSHDPFADFDSHFRSFFSSFPSSRFRASQAEDDPFARFGPFHDPFFRGSLFSSFPFSRFGRSPFGTQSAFMNGTLYWIPALHATRLLNPFTSCMSRRSTAGINRSPIYL